eukprot:8672602-Pyramimonas_sp.AAC.1
MKAERRRGKLWAPKGKSRPLQALEDLSTGSLLTSPSDMCQALEAQWILFLPLRRPRSRS